MSIPKFRAWSPLYAQICEVKTFDFRNNMFEILVTRPAEYGGTKFTTFVSCENAVLMQSTGLHDKNGVEIFERYILRVEDEYGSYTTTVGSAQCGFAIDVRGMDYDKTTLEWALTLGVESIEVIGNIHENSELLEQQNG